MAMRLGAEDKKKLSIAVGLGFIVLILVVHFLLQTFASSGSSPASAPPPSPEAQPMAAEAPAPTEPAAQAGQEYQQPYAHEAVKVSSPLDPTLHPELMKEAESLAYTGSGRNIFSPDSAPPVIPKPIASPRQTAAARAAAEAAEGPPPPPRIDLSFYGYAAEKNGHKQVFLLHGSDIFIASEGDVVDRRYRVGKIGTTSVEIEDLPYHDTQTLPLVQ